MDRALEILPADYWRWYLTANAPESADSSFTWEHFQVTVNKDLADVLGNFVNRVLRFAANRFGSNVPAGGTWGASEQALVQELSQMIEELRDHMEDMQLRRSAASLRAIWSLGNEYFNAAAPWKAVKEDPEGAQMMVRISINLIRVFSLLSAPFLPQTAARLMQALHLAPELDVSLGDLNDELRAIAPGAPFDVPDVLFVKLEDDQIAKWKAER
jgi:methionyl-tRNA synthetase